MKTIRFIHTADIHFGVENYGRIDPETGIHTRLLDFERAFSACVDRAIAESIDFFIFCGDAYKTAHSAALAHACTLAAACCPNTGGDYCGKP
jgi:DNA repair exonuclease SbcCD nuclease subunit